MIPYSYSLDLNGFRVIYSYNIKKLNNFYVQISGETASSTVSAGSLSDLSNLANASLYGFEDYHGVDIGVVRAVRLWFSPLAGEIPIEIKLKENDTKLGFAISRTEEVLLLAYQNCKLSQMCVKYFNY